MHEQRWRMGSGSRSRLPLAATLMVALAAPLHAQHGPAVASKTHLGVFSVGNSYTPSIAASSRLMAFASEAGDLVADDTNGHSDVFVRDRLTGTLLCISRSVTGATGNSGSGSPAISADGRYVAFASEASDLVPGDTNEFSDIFVYDLRGGTLERVSVSSAGLQADLPCHQPTISGDGRMVAFESYSKVLAQPTHEGVGEIFVRDRVAGTTFIASAPGGQVTSNGTSGNPHLSRDGRRVAFESWSNNLGPGDLHFGVDVWVADLTTGKVVLVSRSYTGGPTSGSSYAATLSADGNLVAFDSGAKNLVPGDTNSAGDVYVADLQAGSMQRVSLSSAGAQGNNHSGNPSISGDGRFVTFSSYASTLVPGDTNNASDIFVHDRVTGETARLSTSASGQEGNGLSAVPVLAIDSGLVIFESWATNLVPGDFNAAGDIFVRAVGDVLDLR